MTRKLLTVTVAALASLGVSAAFAASSGHHRNSDHGFRHVSRAHTQFIRPGFAFGAVGLSAGYAASPVDTGAGCRAQVRKIWPAAPTIIGGGKRPLEMLFDACMATGGRIP
jgi:hypothetical protein